MSSRSSSTDLAGADVPLSAGVPLTAGGPAPSGRLAPSGGRAPAAGPADGPSPPDGTRPPGTDPGEQDGGPAPGPQSPPSCNEVVLVGRVAAPAEERTLPSGDVLATWRLVVDRPPPRRPVREGARPVTVDTLDCVAWTGRLRQSARRLQAGDVVRVEGALRRRFWRGGAGASSRCEIEVDSVRRLSRGPTSRPTAPTDPS